MLSFEFLKRLFHLSPLIVSLNVRPWIFGPPKNVLKYMHTLAVAFCSKFIYYMDMANENLPTVFHYNDFRKFLDDYQQERQKFDKNFNRSNVCRLLGLSKSRSFFNDVIKGKTVTSTFIDRFIKVFELKKDEAQFFRVLVKYNQAMEPGERELYFQQLISLNKTPRQILDLNVYEYFKEWRHSVIRAMLDVYNCTEDDYGELGKKINPPLTEKTVRESINLLKNLELVAQDEKGFLKPTQKIIQTPPYINDDLVKHYQMQSLETAKRALFSNSDQMQNVSTKLISISELGLKRIERQLQKFKSEVTSIIHKDHHESDRIYELAMFLVPVTKIKKGGKQ
ncbi:MAG: TIGR02147 family protein [Chitinivibrionales bacterium]|nr:TIGR02147 family protein [Chitinivibrionales bacterium]